MPESRTLLVLLPYLMSSGKVPIRGIEFQSCDDSSGLTNEVTNHLQVLSRIFVQRHMDPIGKMLCAAVPMPDERAQETVVLRRLSEAQLLISYIYTAPHPGGGASLCSEQATLFALEPTRVPDMLIWGSTATATGDMVEGYKGSRNFDVEAVLIEKSVVPPEPPWIAQNLAQDLHTDINHFFKFFRNSALEGLFDEGDYYGERMTSRAFTALKWYWRSCRLSVSREEALVDLSIAFESLFQLAEGQRLTERFKESILTLLGPIERLDSWIEQFYAARSKIVHEGSAPELYFYPSSRQSRKGGKPGDADVLLRPLWEYGLRVFRLCLNTLLTGAAAAKEVGLEESFVHNQERLQLICQRLGEPVTAHERLDAVWSLVDSLDANTVGALEYGVELKAVFGVAKRLLASYKDAHPRLSPDAEATLLEAVDLPEEEEGKRLEQLQRLSTQLAKLWPVRDPADRKTWATMTSFLNYATSTAFRLRIAWKAAPKPHSPPGAT